MRLLILALFALLPLSVVADSQRTTASSVKWKDQFGSSNAEPHTTFCLMARGFFRSPTKNIQAVTDAWLKKHPKASLIRASSMPDRDNDPQSRLTFVWIVDGDESLNLELVRQGCFHPLTQTIGKEQTLEVPKADYDAFTKKLTVAAEYAHKHNLGLWSEPEEPDNPND